MPKIFIVEDHPLLRDGVRRVIDADGTLELAGEATSAREALEGIIGLRPDLVITDLTLPDKSGLDLVKDLKIHCPTVRVLVLSMHDELLYAERVVKAGGRGYLMKQDATDAVLGTAIRRVLGGGIHLSSQAAELILSGMSGKREKEPRARVDRLTDRELQVFEMIGRGGNVHQIAERLRISPRTVDAHRVHIREKLGLRDAAALLRYAVRWSEGETCPGAADA